MYLASIIVEWVLSTKHWTFLRINFQNALCQRVFIASRDKKYTLSCRSSVDLKESVFMGANVILYPRLWHNGYHKCKKRLLQEAPILSRNLCVLFWPFLPLLYFFYINVVFLQILAILCKKRYQNVRYPF